MSDDDQPQDATIIQDSQDKRASSAKPGLLGRLGRRLRGDGALERSAKGKRRSKLRALARRGIDNTRAALERADPKASIDALLRTMTDPRAVRLAQLGMGTLGNASMEAIFTREPDARLLFEYAQWCESQSDRGHIMAVVMHDALSPQGAFNQLAGPLISMGTGGDVRVFWTSRPRTRDMTDTLERARTGLLRTLASMAAAATNHPAPEPDTSSQELERWLRQSDIPPRFQTLVDRVTDTPTPHTEPTPSTQRGSETSTQDTTPPQTTALGRTANLLPALSLPPSHRFILGPYLLFLQSYLTRNMVDALPNLASKIRQELDPQESDPAAANPPAEPNPDPTRTTPPDIVIDEE